nr:MAG TPA: hypothetical protein [Caudoviricetes sp.]
MFLIFSSTGCNSKSIIIVYFLRCKVTQIFITSKYFFIFISIPKFTS